MPKAGVVIVTRPQPQRSVSPDGDGAPASAPRPAVMSRAVRPSAVAVAAAAAVATTSQPAGTAAAVATAANTTAAPAVRYPTAQDLIVNTDVPAAAAGSSRPKISLATPPRQKAQGTSSQPQPAIEQQVVAVVPRDFGDELFFPEDRPRIDTTGEFSTWRTVPVERKGPLPRINIPVRVLENAGLKVTDGKRR